MGGSFHLARNQLAAALRVPQAKLPAMGLVARDCGPVVAVAAMVVFGPNNIDYHAVPRGTVLKSLAMMQSRPRS